MFICGLIKLWERDKHQKKGNNVPPKQNKKKSLILFLEPFRSKMNLKNTMNEKWKAPNRPGL